jgi:hypothetical protein
MYCSHPVPDGAIQLPYICTWLPCGAIQLQYSRRLPNGTIQLPSVAFSFHTMPVTYHRTTHSLIHKASKWHHRDPTQLMWLPHSSCGCGTIGSHLPYSSHTLHAAPIRCMRLPCGTCSCHMVHAAPVQCTLLPCSTHDSQLAITCHMRLPYGAICLPHGAIYLQ